MAQHNELDPEYVEKRKIHHMKKFYEVQQKKRLQDEVRITSSSIVI